jgi:hypothetical protein
LVGWHGGVPLDRIRCRLGDVGVVVLVAGADFDLVRNAPDAGDSLGGALRVPAFLF